MKKEMRKNILQLRQAMNENEVALKSEIICRHIVRLDLYKEAKTIMAYLPFRNEVDCSYLFSQIWKEGKRLVVPVCESKTISLIPSLLNRMEDTQPGTWGILEPKPECLYPLDAGEIDLVIVPGVAFDPQGNRLGYGGGYYDRFLPRLTSGTPKIAVAFQLQIINSLTPDKFDQPMDMVITEENLYQCPKS